MQEIDLHIRGILLISGNHLSAEGILLTADLAPVSVAEVILQTEIKVMLSTSPSMGEVYHLSIKEIFHKVILN